MYLELESADGTPSSEAMAEMLSVEASSGNADFAQIGAEVTQVSVGETLPPVAESAAVAGKSSLDSTNLASGLSAAAIGGIAAGAVGAAAIFGAGVAVYVKRRSQNDTE